MSRSAMRPSGPVATSGRDWNRAHDCFFCHHPRAGEIFATRWFSVVCDDSPLVEGHLMIHSRQHWGCAGELPADQLAELIEVKAEVAGRITATYGHTSFYEHGRAGHCSANAACNHFHLHALPVTCSIVEPLAARYRRVPLADYGAITDTFERFGDYLYFEDNRGAMSFFPATSTVESHLLRTLIANAIGAADRANWEEMRDSAMVDTARAKLEPTDEHRARQLSR